MGLFFALICILFFLEGCGFGTICAEYEVIDVNSLASTSLGTPDPRKDSGIREEYLRISWKLAPNSTPAIVEVDIIYKDWSRESFVYQIIVDMGKIVHPIDNSKSGLLSYKVTATDVFARTYYYLDPLWTDPTEGW